MKKAELEAFLIRKGFKKDRYGNYSKDKKHRWKLKKAVARLEIKCLHGWGKVYGNYYKNLEITENDKIGRKK